MKSVAITGHKKHEIGLWGEKHPAFPYLKEAYIRLFRRLIEEESVEWFVCSGEQGLELYAAYWLLEVKQEYPEVKLAMLLPFYNQEKSRKEDMQALFQKVLSYSDYIDYISKREYTQPWQLKQRNEFIVGRTEGLVTFFNGVERTYPWYFIQEAKKKQENQEYQVWILDPEQLQTLFEEMNQSFD